MPKADIVLDLADVVGKEIADWFDRRVMLDLTKYKPKRTRHRAIARSKKRQFNIKLARLHSHNKKEGYSDSRSLWGEVAEQWRKVND